MSQYPPPFTPPARRSNNTVLIVILCVVGGICLICGIGAVASGMWAFNKVGPMVGCIVNMTAAREGVLDYAKANNGTLPNAETWQDDIKQYVGRHLKKEDLGPFKAMDPNGEWYCETDGVKTGIAYNSDLSGKKLDEVQNQYTTVAVFEIEAPKRNAHEPYKRRDKSTSPKLFGEPRGWLYMFLQGHDIEGIEGESGGNFRVRTGQTAGSSE